MTINACGTARQDREVALRLGGDPARKAIVKLDSRAKGWTVKLDGKLKEVCETRREGVMVAAALVCRHTAKLMSDGTLHVEWHRYTHCFPLDENDLQAAPSTMIDREGGWWNRAETAS